jgi:hypothetical protein
MSTENPYRSPESDTRIDEPVDPTGAAPTATWRYLVLALIGLPAAIGLFVASLSILQERNNPLTQQLFGLSITGSIVLTNVVACAVIPVYWRAPAQRRVTSTASNGAAFVQGAIWVLALIAAPTAFVTTCTPIGFVAMASTRAPPAMLLGVAVGIFCVYLVGKLAYDLWLDAIGRQKENPLEEIQRPIPRLQARQAESADAGANDV